MEHQADGLHLRTHHAGAAQEDEQPGQHPGPPPIGPADAAAGGGHTGEAAHTGNDEAPDEDHGEAEAEEGQGGANAVFKGAGGVAGGVAAADKRGGQGGEKHQRAVPAAGGGEVAGTFDLAAAAQAHAHQHRQVKKDTPDIQPHKQTPPVVQCMNRGRGLCFGGAQKWLQIQLGLR